MKDFFQNKKILITGHSGFKGSWLTQILLNGGAKISGISLLPEERPNLFDILEIRDEVNNYFYDIRNYQAVREVFKKEKPEIVFHLAAQPIVRESYADPLKTFSTNVMGTANVLEAMKEVGGVKAAVIITTDKVYKNNEWIYPYRENDPLGGHDPYSASKAAADLVTDSYLQSFFNPKDYGNQHNTLVAITRAGNVLGGGDWAKDRIIPDLIRAVYQTKGKLIIRNPQAIRPWQHVFEPLAGYLQLAKKLAVGEKKLAGAWNFGPNEESHVSVEKLVQTAFEILQKGEYEIQADEGEREDGILRLDATKAKCLLGWCPQFNFQESLKTTLDWYQYYYQSPTEIIDFSNQQIKSFFNEESLNN